MKSQRAWSKKSRKNGEFVSDNTKLSCKQRAGLLVLGLVWKKFRFPVFKEMALRSQFAIKRPVIKFLNKFMMFTLNGDVAPLRTYFDRYHDPKAFETMARKYADKFRTSIYATAAKLARKDGIKAQRGATVITSASEVAQREEIRAVALFNLFKVAHTYRLCEFVSFAADFFGFFFWVKIFPERISRSPSRHKTWNPKQSWISKLSCLLVVGQPQEAPEFPERRRLPPCCRRFLI
jgi:hypothetical protein